MDTTSIRPPIAPELFDDLGDHLWVMHCAEGPVPRRAADAVQAMMGRELRPWEMRWNEDFLGLPREARRLAADLISGRETDVSLLSTTSSGLIAVAHAIDWKPGDEVVLPLGEFPANVWPWKALERRGVRVREVELWDGHVAGGRAWHSLPPTLAANPEQRLIEALSADTRVLAVSWVRFQDGLKLDLGALGRGCCERDVALVVDGIQGVGTQSVDLEGLSAIATGGHKGLLAPQGLGFLWTDEGFRAATAPTGGWLSVDAATDFSRPNTDHERVWRCDGERHEQGVPNLIGCAAFVESLRVLGDAGVDRIADHIDRLQEALLSRLAESADWRGEAARLSSLRAAGRLGSILSLHHGGDGEERLAALLADGFERGIYASVREGYLRIALHGWHSESDVERLVDWVSGPRSRR